MDRAETDSGVVVLSRIEPRGFGIAVGDRKTKATASAVLVDGVRIGRIEKGSSESRRKVGRLLGSLRGYPVHWKAELESGRSVGWRFYSRRDAVRELVEEWSGTPDGTHK